MRAAILDLGTNTFHLLIADISGNSAPVPVLQETIAVKLGEGGISAGYISAEAFKRGIRALKNFRAQIDLYRPDEIRSAATSAIRTASNGKEFIERIRTETGLNLNIIPGDEEAKLIYQGVREAVNLDPCSLIMDIGGGSVEFIICDQKRVFWKNSYQAGAARLMDMFHHTDPISEEEIKKINDHLDIMLAGLRRELDIYRPALMVGSAGAFETFAAMQDPGFRVSFEYPEFIIDTGKFRDISDVLLKSTHEERMKMETIIPLRKDMIVVSCVLINYILGISGISALKLSAYALKEGILFGIDHAANGT